MRDILKSIEEKRGGAVSAPSSGYASGSKNRILEGINEKRTAEGKTTYGSLQRNATGRLTYGAVLGQQKGLYEQAMEDNRKARFGEKLRGITGGTVKGALQTYAADLENAWATMDQTLAEINGRNPFAKKLLSDDVQKQRNEEIAQQRAYAAVMQQQADELSKRGTQNIQRARSYTGNVGDTLIEAGVALGQMGVDAAATAVLPGLGTGLMAARVYGGNAKTAREEGANLLQQNLYGAGGAAAAVGLGKLFGGAMGAYGAGATDDLVEAIASKASSNAGKNIVRAVIKAQGEGFEEAVEELLDPALKAIYKNNIKQNYRDMDWREVLQSYIVGALTGGVAEGVSMATGSYKAANAILDDPEVQKALATYWNKAAENGALNKETRETFKQAAAEMETTRQVMNIARTAGIDVEAARELLKNRKGMDAQAQNEAQRAAQAETDTKKAAMNMAEIGAGNENISDAGQGNGNDGIGTGESTGVFPAAAGESYADERGNQREVRPGVGADPAAVVREVSAAELGITGGDATRRVQIVDPERVGGAVQTAANAVLDAGLEPVAVQGDLIVNGVSVNGWIENGKIYFRADAVDSRGNAVDPVKIVNHELFHEAVEGDPELVESAGEIVREKMTEAEFMAMRDAYKTAYGKVQDFSDWTEEEIEAYILQEIVADAYAGMNQFSNKAETTEAVRAAAPQVGQNQTDRSRTETRGPPMGKAALNLKFENEFDEWLKNTKEEERLRDGSRFLIGTTSDKLRMVGVDDYEIYFGKSKIAKIMQNPEMTDGVIKAAVKVVEDPVIVLDSKTVAGSIVMFGDAKTDNGKPVMVALLLHPETRTGEVLDYGVVTSAYGRRVNNAQNLIDTSIVRFIDQDEKRTSEWSKALGLQLPSASTKRGSTKTVSQTETESKGNVPRASVEVPSDSEQSERQKRTGEPGVKMYGSEEPLTMQEQDLIHAGSMIVNGAGGKTKVELQRFRDGWHFRVLKGRKELFVSNAYKNAGEAAKEAVRIGEQYAQPEATKAQEALNEAADEAIEMPPPVGRFTKAERDLEEDRLRTLLEADAPWGTGDITLKNDTEAAAAAEEFADDRAEKQAIQDLAQNMEEYTELLRGQMPIKDTETAEKKITSEVEQKKEPRKKRINNTWRSFMRTAVNAGDTIHRIARETGIKSLDGYYFRALAARQAGTEWIAGKRHDIMGRTVGQGLNEIFNSIREKGRDYYEQFQLYMYHQLNIDRMSRNYDELVREAKAEVTRLEKIEPGLSKLADTELKRIAESYSLDAELARDYLQAKANREKALGKRQKPVFGFEVTADDSRRAVENLLEKHPEFEELAKSVYEFSNDLLQYRVDAGIIRQEDKDFLQRLYPHYVPTFRATAKEQAQILHKGGLSVSKAIGRATGSNEVLLPLHVSLARQAMAVTKNGAINRLGNALLEARDKNKDILGEYILDVKEAEASFSEDSFDDEEVLEPRKENVITVIENGKRYDLTLDPGMTDAFKAFEPDRLAGNELAQLAKKEVDLFKKLVTAWNPLFVVRNAARDFQDALYFSKDTKAWIQNFPEAYKEILRSGKYWQMYKGLGGNSASIFNYETGETEESKSRVVEKIEAINSLVEAAPRMAEFMAVVKKAEAKGELTEADLMEAFEAAQDITTNFGRAGSVGKLANKYFVPFLNPSIQGADKFIRNLTEREGLGAWMQLVVRSAMLGIAPAIINGMLHRGVDDWEEEWDDISEATKANNYLFKLRDGVWLRIPRGRALAVLATTGVAAEELAKGNDIDPKDLLEVIKDNIAPQNPFEANIFKAWFDAKLFSEDNPGQTWYGGQIESEYMQSFRPGERYDESTDYVSRWLGKTFDLSPAKINYLIDQYSGVFGDLILPYITPESSAGLRYVKNVPVGIGIRKNFSVDTVTNNETTGEWYDIMDELKWDMNGGDISAGTTYRYMSKANGAVSDYYRKIREIESDPELSHREKNELTRELRKGLIAYQKEILETEPKYQLAVENYYDDHPELDHGDPKAVKAYMEQYNAQQTSEEYYKNEEKTADLMEAIVYREVNREVLGAEYALETYSSDVYEKAVKVHNSAAVSYDTYYDYYFGTKDMHADRDENGKSISGTKKAKVLGFIADMEIPDEQKDALAIDAGYKAGSWKAYANGKNGGGSGSGGRSKKEKSVKIKNTLTKPVGISYNRSMSIAARTPSADTSAYEGIRKATGDLRKKNPWYALPTGNPELDEERPAAARYFATGKL